MHQKSKQFFCALNIILMLALCTNAYSVAYQIFPNITYTNPATLNVVKKAQVIFGDSELLSDLKFEGKAGALVGSTTSKESDFMPYGRFAARLTPKLVAGLDVTQPVWTDIQYPPNTVTQFFSTGTILRDVNISPKLSYQATNKLALGIGFDANDLYDAELNVKVPPNGILKNKYSSWAYGFDTGFFYMISNTTFVNFSYYSKIVQHLSGKSNWGPIHTHSTVDVYLPATWIGNVVQFLTPKWILSGTLRFTEWDVLNRVLLKHTAIGKINIPQFYFNNFSAQLATQYMLTDKFALLGGLSYDPNVIPTRFRPVGLPAFSTSGLALGGEYAITKQLKTKLVYAHAFSYPKINTIAPAGRIRGNEDVNISVIDLSFTYDV